MYNYSDELYHFGVLGMKWGHRKSRPFESSSGSSDMSHRELRKAQKKYDRAYRKYRYEAYNKAADDVNSGKSPLIKKTNKRLETLKAKHGEEAVSKALSGLPTNKEAQSDVNKILDDYKKTFDKMVSDNIERKLGKRPE